MSLHRFACLLLALLAESATMPSIDEMAPPIRGLNPAKLRDTFDEAHNGHLHEAIDILAPRGTPVVAVVPGRIRKLFLSRPGGNTIYQFDNAEVYCYYYAHLDRYSDGLREGMQVGRGDVIGFVGSTGNADPGTPHLHFAIFNLGPEKHWWKGQAINPYSALLEAVKREANH
jgi:murein DD-endopeptidase MepM/ murein hydrolase activator NlpD